MHRLALGGSGGYIQIPQQLGIRGILHGNFFIIITCLKPASAQKTGSDPPTPPDFLYKKSHFYEVKFKLHSIFWQEGSERVKMCGPSA